MQDNLLSGGITIVTSSPKVNHKAVKKARPKRQQQQQQQGSRDARALKHSTLAEDYFPSAADLLMNFVGLWRMGRNS